MISTFAERVRRSVREWRTGASATTVTRAEARQLLRESNAVLVHFSTVMETHQLRFPADLNYVIANRNTCQPSCSTITPSDGLRRYPGHVGLIVEPASDRAIHIAHSGDAGSRSSQGAVTGFGAAPDLQACRDSILRRGDGYNEWRIGPYRVRGVFVAPAEPLLVSVFVDSHVQHAAAGVPQHLLPAPGTLAPGENELTRIDVMRVFSQLRCYSVENGSFIETRRNGTTARVTARDIYSCWR